MELTISLLKSTVRDLKFQRDNKPPGYYNSSEIKRICDVAEKQLNQEISQHEKAIEVLENFKEKKR